MVGLETIGEGLSTSISDIKYLSSYLICSFQNDL
jgi:hypothetical protein